jgi:hypothetical protein
MKVRVGSEVLTLTLALYHMVGEGKNEKMNRLKIRNDSCRIRRNIWKNPESDI